LGPRVPVFVFILLPHKPSQSLSLTHSRDRASLGNRLFCFRAPGQMQRLAALAPARPSTTPMQSSCARSCHDENVEPVRRRLASCELRPRRPTRPGFRRPAIFLGWKRPAAPVIRAPALILFRPSTHQFARSLSRPRHRFFTTRPGLSRRRLVRIALAQQDKGGRSRPRARLRWRCCGSDPRSRTRAYVRHYLEMRTGDGGRWRSREPSRSG
jgi:hypothetical protein